MRMSGLGRVRVYALPGRTPGFRHAVEGQRHDAAIARGEGALDTVAAARVPT